MMRQIDLETLSITQIDMESALYEQAKTLRYALFFAEQNLPYDLVADQYETQSEHWAVLDKTRLLAYGRLTQISDVCVSVSQIAVRPNHQRIGLGARLMDRLEERAAELSAQHIILYARETAIPFYEKRGYISQGELFPSSRTGIPHVEMKKVIETE